MTISHISIPESSSSLSISKLQSKASREYSFKIEDLNGLYEIEEEMQTIGSDDSCSIHN